MSTDRIKLMKGDSRELLKGLGDNSIDSCVTDPPYALVSIVKRFANSPRNEKTENPANPYGRTGRGFMGQKWDTGETAFDAAFWAEVWRVMKPGAHLLAFSGTRTYHRMAVAIEDAGFEVRDQGAWAYGSGFPKSHNQHGDWEGWGTALKPAWEPICIARKPLEGTVAENLAKWGVGALNINACRVGDEVRTAAFTSLAPCTGNRLGAADTAAARRGTQGEPKEYIGRWPANIIHDGSDEVLETFPDAPGQQADESISAPSSKTSGIYGALGRRGEKSQNDGNLGDVGFRMRPGARRGDSGSAARFFYTAKADAEDRIGSKHPTVKPVDLMQYLVRLVTPKGGVVLDPFAGTGTTGEAAFREGMRCTMIEREANFVTDIERRISLLLSGPEERARAAIKAKIADGRIKDDAGPLFDAEVA